MLNRARRTRIPSDARLVGVDLARFVAIVGMISVHVWPPAGDDGLSLLQSLPLGMASTLFAVLGGVSIVLSTRRLLAVAGAGAARIAVAVRGTAVVIVGLTLGTVAGGSPAVIVLVYFGVAMWATIPLLAAPSRVVAAVAVVLALVSGPVNAWLRAQLEIVGETGTIGWGDLAHPLTTLRGVLSTGTYPVDTWTVYLLVGILVGRLLLSIQGRTRALVTLLCGGVVLAVLASSAAEVVWQTWGRAAWLSERQGLVGHLPHGITLELIARSPGFGASLFFWPSLLDDAPHTGTLLDIVRGTAIAVAVIAACTLAWNAAGTRVRRLLLPIRAAGAAPLTVYAAHIAMLMILFRVAQGAGPVQVAVGPVALALHVGVVLLIGGILAAVGRRGPLEGSIARLIGAVVRSDPADADGRALVHAPGHDIAAPPAGRAQDGR